MTISEKVAYLKGLAEGLGVNAEDSKEGKVLAVVIDALEQIGLSIEDLENNVQELGEELDAISDDLENAAVLDLVFSNDPTQTAIEEVKGENGSFRFDGRSLAYDFQNKGTHTVDIFNAGGQLVSSVTLDDAHGVVSLSGLRPGAYIYRIRGEKKPMSGKMLVK